MYQELDEELKGIKGLKRKLQEDRLEKDMESLRKKIKDLEEEKRKVEEKYANMITKPGLPPILSGISLPDYIEKEKERIENEGKHLIDDINRQI